MQHKRIVSLVPSLTELLIDLGLEKEVIGRTRFCIHPSSKIDDIPIIGGTKNPNIAKIRKLKPDFVLANLEENRKEDVEELQKFTQVEVTNINTISEALDTISDLGKKFGKEEKSISLVSKIKKVISQKPEPKLVRTAYFIWRNPWMVAANYTYINDVMQEYGLLNVFSDHTRYPEINLHQLQKKSPELILLSSEPYPFKQKHIIEIQSVCPNCHIELIDGEWFSWYGSRMLSSFTNLHHWRNKHRKQTN